MEWVSRKCSFSVLKNLIKKTFFQENCKTSLFIGNWRNYFWIVANVIATDELWGIKQNHPGNVFKTCLLQSNEHPLQFTQHVEPPEFWVKIHAIPSAWIFKPCAFIGDPFIYSQVIRILKDFWNFYFTSGDSCCNPWSLGSIQKLLEDHLPGVYVHSLMIGNNLAEDTKNGFFFSVNDQIDIACKKIAADPKLQNGFAFCFLICKYNFKCSKLIFL